VRLRGPLSSSRRTVVGITAVIAAAAISFASSSRAQRVPAGRALSVLVGTSGGEAITDRLDGHRTNRSSTALPARALRVIWSQHTHALLHPPLVQEDGTVIVVDEQGEAFFFNADGTEHAKVALGPGPMSAPALLADGTLVAANANGEVVGARRGAVVFRSHIVDSVPPAVLVEDAPHGRVAPRPRATIHGHLTVAPRHAVQRAPEREVRPALEASTLPLEDGGVVVAFGHELVVLDAQGTLRRRTSSPVSVASPLLAVGDAVAFVADNGDAYTWSLRDSTEAPRAHGSFGAALDGAIAAFDDRHLVAVVEGARVVVLDLVTTTTETRLGSTRGAFTGTFAVGPEPGSVLLEEMTLTGTRVLAVDKDGQASPFATFLTSIGIQPVPDAGAAPSTPTHTMLLADPSGAVAYGTVDGHIGVATPTSKIELGTLLCGATPTLSLNPLRQGDRFSAGFAGLVPAGPRAFVVACTDGLVALVKETTD
jgi:hypothetical protein